MRGIAVGLVDVAGWTPCDSVGGGSPLLACGRQATLKLCLTARIKGASVPCKAMLLSQDVGVSKRDSVLQLRPQWTIRITSHKRYNLIRSGRLPRAPYLRSPHNTKASTSDTWRCSPPSNCKGPAQLIKHEIGGPAFSLSLTPIHSLRHRLVRSRQYAYQDVAGFLRF